MGSLWSSMESGLSEVRKGLRFGSSPSAFWRSSGPSPGKEQAFRRKKARPEARQRCPRGAGRGRLRPLSHDARGRVAVGRSDMAPLLPTVIVVGWRSIGAVARLLCGRLARSAGVLKRRSYFRILENIGERPSLASKADAITVLACTRPWRRWRDHRDRVCAD
jgi:hypothetical protein